MKKHLFIYFLSFCTIFMINLQNGFSSDTENPMNYIKINPFSPLIKNYSFQYERILTKRYSAGLSFRFMPQTSLPYKDMLFNLADITDPKDKEILSNVMLSNYAITPEFRYYTGKNGYGKGFYLSLFYRYATYDMNNLSVDIEIDEKDETFDFFGNVKSHTGGIMIGRQWSLSKYLCLDWWIMGPHIGVSSGSITGLSSVTLTQNDQQEIRDKLDDALMDIDIPMFKYSIDTASDKVRVDVDGPWAGLRFGFTFGVKF